MVSFRIIQSALVRSLNLYFFRPVCQVKLSAEEAAAYIAQHNKEDEKGSSKEAK